MTHRIEISSKISDAQATAIKTGIEKMGFSNIKDIKLTYVYTLDYEFSSNELEKISKMLANPITQTYKINSPTDMQTNWIIEIGFLPGVTDNVAHTTQESIHDLFGIKFDKTIIFTSQMIFIEGDFKEEDIKNIAEDLSNKVIQRVHVKNKQKYMEDNGMDYIIPRIKLLQEPKSDIVNIDINDEELIKIGKQGIMNEDGSRRGPLALDLDSMKIIRDYFKKEKRMPTDIELESIAQTWSEHCKHTIFANQIDEIEKGIYKEYIQNATNKIRTERGDRDFCVSVFKDNSGAIIFDENYLVTDKVETHNSPSALDPFGGAITGIVGVNRDTIGFGQGAMPIINRYGYCFGYPEDKSLLFRGENKTNQILSPKRIMDGVIEGVEVGGNCSGIPTPQGFVYFDNSYRGKPLVFVGTIGLIPRDLKGKPSHTKEAQPGDYIVVVGGRVGKDGIHGATFSSEAMDSGSPATAVQIGDPITQKKLSDAIVKGARDLNLYNSITDNGAGGISCSVAEMARECGGFVVDLEKNPVKYPGIQPWEIWISESQERMTLSVPKDKIEAFLELMEKRSVEATVIGKFNDSNRAIVKYKEKVILDIDMDFLHDGAPKKTLSSTYTKQTYEEPNFSFPFNLNSILLKMLSRHNIAGFEFISRQYDHEVQASSILKPLQGIGEVNAYATATKPLYDSNKAIIISQGINSKYSQIDTYDMAASAIDTAVRNVIAAGGDLNRLALLDNFCWCSSNDPERLGQLKAAAKACYDYSIAYKTPFISGKDSMFNDFKGYDKNDNPTKISVLPTLLVSSIGIVDDYNKIVSLDAKFTDDLVYVIGETKNELGASEYFELVGENERGEPYVGNSVPKVNASMAYQIYSAFNKAINEGVIASSIPVNSGGLGVALAKTCIAGQLGAKIDLTGLNRAENVDRDDFILFSESQSRIIVTIAPENKEKFEEIFKNVSFAKIGKIVEEEFSVIGLEGNEIIKINVKDLTDGYKRRFKK
ncbi:phosphoribosylformylglycinamidine synthase subunit PurS [Candidatus Pacearchaeota archaeon]|nr:phosphoribosylformylglycinamidine synthase subunit PurS [Candidatus Pacearchaeota archaeon]